jgi:hypothetical protein
MMPNPGSVEAIAQGCNCPVFDNQYGEGIPGCEGKFWINQTCVVHASLLEERSYGRKLTVGKDYGDLFRGKMHTR